MIDQSMRLLAKSLLQRLDELESTHPQWMWEFDVHSQELAECVEVLANTNRSELSNVESLVSDPGRSIRTIADTLTSAACWICINCDSDTRQQLLTTLAPWGHISALLANLSGRLLLRFQNTGDVRYVRLCLAAIALLADNADPREESAFIQRLSKALVEHGHAPMPILQEFAMLSTGQARSLLENASRTN
ncbi:MAG: hypothetical protein H8E66_31915 [Planctomycetes bacterium]|nr:hypothetical protein [Planctomycetota bacterium]